ncbi:MAG: SDR family NAD(P)-dependent oxidoreductase [Coxiellaceae bacterium]|nr:SDR family NAD(P)-dependent oxidoreductase [Coxiellaceae bacterium]
MTFIKDQVIVITGAVRGIGKDIAMACYEQGAKVGVIDVNQDGLNQLPAGMLRFHGDVSQSKDLEAFYQQVKDQFGGIHYVVANAVAITNSAEQSREEMFDQMIAVNFKGMYQTLLLVLPYMEQGGAMVSLIAASAFDHVKVMSGSWAEYTAIKHAVRYLSRSLAGHNDKQVRVNCVSPGLVKSERVDALAQRMKWSDQDMADTTVAKRLAELGDITRAVLFLLSPEASYINGVDLCVDGGWAVAGAQLPD